MVAILLVPFSLIGLVTSWRELVRILGISLLVDVPIPAFFIWMKRKK